MVTFHGGCIARVRPDVCPFHNSSRRVVHIALLRSGSYNTTDALDFVSLTQKGVTQFLTRVVLTTEP